MLMDTVRALCPLFGPSGLEDEVRAFICREAEPYADEMTVSPNGTLIVFKKGRKTPKRRVLLAAHMDEVGVIVTSIMESGFLRFAFIGGMDRRVVLGKRVFLGPDRIPGIIGMKPIHLTDKDERKRIPKVRDLYIDIGAKDRAAAEALVEEGTFGCFDPEITDLQNGFLRAKALDDRVGCAILLETLKEELPVDTWFAFTVQEEIGSKGAFGAAFRVEPDVALILEGTSAADTPDRDGADRVCVPLHGPVLSMMDKGSISDPGLFRLLRDLAEERNIPWQIKTRLAGTTDARAMQTNLNGCKVAGISAPLRYIHSPSCVGNVKDFEAMKVLVGAFLDRMEDYHG